MTKKTVFLSALMLLAAASCTTGNDTEDYTQYVEPRIGTAHCRYFHFAPGALPYGMAKPGPSTNGSLGNPSGWEATGYDYRDTSIEGFPCVHEFQVGGITLMAMNGDSIFTTPGLPTDTITKKGYRSAYSHDDEVATAGYYSVMLKDYGIRAEMTATERVALQRFTFPKGETSTVLFNIGSRMGESGAVKDASVELVNDTTVEGWVITFPEYVKAYQPDATVPIYFSATVDRKPTKCVAFNDNTLSATPNKATGVGAGLYLQFATDEGEAVTAKVGISYTSVENARLNLHTEAENITFDEAKQRSHDIWQEMLSRIEVETENREDKVKFYSGLYHALLGRGVCSDVNGAYPRNDGSVGQIPEKDGKLAFNVYNTDAMWGGQWNLTQLWLMAYPEHISDFISSHLQVYKDCGWLSDGLANSRFVSGVGTNELTLMIAAAYNCGIRDFDIDLAYEACRKNELDGENRPRGAGKDDTADFVKYGYCPYPAPEDSQIGKGISTNRCRKIEGKHHTFLQKASELSPHRASSAYCQVPHLGHENPYHPVQFPYAFGNKPHLFAAIFERFYTERKGYPTPRKAAKAILHPFLHPILHLKPSVNTGYPWHWCRKCRIFSQTFFRGEGRNDSQSEYGNPKTPDFFEENIRTFKAKHRNFPSKKSDVFDFRKGSAFRHSTRLQIAWQKSDGDWSYYSDCR